MTYELDFGDGSPAICLTKFVNLTVIDISGKGLTNFITNPAARLGGLTVHVFGLPGLYNVTWSVSGKMAAGGASQTVTSSLVVHVTRRPTLQVKLKKKFHKIQENSHDEKFAIK